MAQMLMKLYDTIRNSLLALMKISRSVINGGQEVYSYIIAVE